MVESNRRVESSLLSKWCQKRVVESCVESSVLYDCHVRVCYKRELKEVQK